MSSTLIVSSKNIVDNNNSVFNTIDNKSKAFENASDFNTQIDSLHSSIVIEDKQKISNKKNS